MGWFGRSLLSLVLAFGLLTLTGASTDELLECRANVTADVKNETAFVGHVKLADYVFTGKMKEMRAGRLLVQVKRAIRGELNETMELMSNDSCAAYIRQSYTGIFMGRRLPGTELVLMHFGPVPLTLANLDRVNAAVKVYPNNQSKSAPPTCLQPIKRTCIKLRDRPSHSNGSISYLTKYKLQNATNLQRILPIELTASHISISIDHLNAVQQFKSNFFLINQWLIAYNG